MTSHRSNIQIDCFLITNHQYQFVIAIHHHENEHFRQMQTHYLMLETEYPDFGAILIQDGRH